MPGDPRIEPRSWIAGRRCLAHDRRELQKFVVQRVGAESVACAVMDVQNGDVLALASTPGYDPNLFNVASTLRNGAVYSPTTISR